MSNDEDGDSDTGSDSVPAPLSTGDDSALSKRHAIRLERYAARKELRREQRKAYKERRKARKKISRGLQQSLEQTDENATEDVKDPGGDAIIGPRSRKALIHAPRMAESRCQTRIVIDCAYDHLMSFKDICKLANQISNCYAFNRRLSVPVQLYVTGLGSTGTGEAAPPTIIPSTVRLRERLTLAGCDTWDLQACDSDYLEMFDASSIVYLCAESPNILPETIVQSNSPTSKDAAHVENDPPTSRPVNEKSVFVIGGLVDHNHLLGHCYRQACDRDHGTARLPIRESGVQLDGRHVLSTLQVFQALAPVVAGLMTWKASLEAAIPPRKKKP